MPAGRWTIWASLAGLLSACAIATPYRTLGIAPPSPQPDRRDVVVAITEVTLGANAAARARFWDQVRAVERSLAQQDGLIGYALRREIFGNRAWTMTVWENEQAIAAFTRSSAHREAVAEGMQATADTRFARFRRPRQDGPPPWREALDHLAGTSRSGQ